MFPTNSDLFPCRHRTYTPWEAGLPEGRVLLLGQNITGQRDDGYAGKRSKLVETIYVITNPTFNCHGLLPFKSIPSESPEVCSLTSLLQRELFTVGKAVNLKWNRIQTHELSGSLGEITVHSTISFQRLKQILPILFRTQRYTISCGTISSRFVHFPLSENAIVKLTRYTFTAIHFF